MELLAPEQCPHAGSAETGICLSPAFPPGSGSPKCLESFWGQEAGSCQGLGWCRGREHSAFMAGPVGRLHCEWQLNGSCRCCGCPNVAPVRACASAEAAAPFLQAGSRGACGHRGELASSGRLVAQFTEIASCFCLPGGSEGSPSRAEGSGGFWCGLGACLLSVT